MFPTSDISIYLESNPRCLCLVTRFPDSESMGEVVTGLEKVGKVSRTTKSRFETEG